MKSYHFRWQKASRDCREIYAILVMLNRQSELSRLIQWADRKHLSGPLSAHQIKYDDSERRLFRYTLASPRLVAIARSLHNLKNLISPTPRYLKKR